MVADEGLRLQPRPHQGIEVVIAAGSKSDTAACLLTLDSFKHNQSCVRKHCCSILAFASFLLSFSFFHMGEPILYGERLSLEGVARVWERSEEVRERMRTSRRLFKSTEDENNFDPRLHMKEVVRNAEILKPLLIRMNRFRTAEGSVSMFKIEQVEKENLRFRNEKLLFIQIYTGAIGVSCLFIPLQLLTFYVTSHVRIKLLHRFLLSGVPVCKEDIKKDAWLCKGMCVLVKRKRQRKSRPRDRVFRELLRLLLGPAEDGEAWAAVSRRGSP